MFKTFLKRQVLWPGFFCLALPCLATSAERDARVVKTSPVNVVFGTRSLAPDTPVNPRGSFVYQSVALPQAECDGCENVVARQEVKWATSGLSFLTEPSRPENGWYVLQSGLKGIGVGVEVKSVRHTGEGHNSKEIHVGLVRLAQDTGAGLVELPPAEFRRQTLFYNDAGQVMHIQEDSIRVSANLKVPTCTSSAGSLTFQLPDIAQTFLRRNVKPGQYTETKVSPEQLIVANCSNNTQSLRVRFIPAGTVSGSTLGPETILTGTDAVTGQESGIGFLMKYSAQGFGQAQQGVVRWNRDFPLTIANPALTPGDGALNQSVRLALRAYYARPEGGREIAAGQVTAKGVYQVSYE